MLAGNTSVDWEKLAVMNAGAADAADSVTVPVKLFRAICTCSEPVAAVPCGVIRPPAFPVMVSDGAATTVTAIVVDWPSTETVTVAVPMSIAVSVNTTPWLPPEAFATAVAVIFVASLDVACGVPCGAAGRPNALVAARKSCTEFAFTIVP